MTRKPLRLILTVLFGVIALTDWAQVLLALIARSDNPPALIALHFGTGAAAAATCWGSWRRMRLLTPIAAAAYGVLTAVLLLALPSLIDLPVEARSGLRSGAGAVLLFGLLSAAYFRAGSRQSIGQVSTGQTNDG